MRKAEMCWAFVGEELGRNQPAVHWSSFANATGASRMFSLWGINDVFAGASQHALLCRKWSRDSVSGAPSLGAWCHYWARESGRGKGGQVRWATFISQGKEAAKGQR